ncbi:MAG: glycoside hydrolase family 30 beta sandwich domain-containing protein [Pirellula sp.]
MPLSIAVGVTDKKLLSVAFVNPDGTLVAPVPVTTTESTAAVTLSVRSRSVTVKVPVSLSPALVSVNDEVSGPPVMTGASAVPVMVIVTVSVSLNGEPSSSVALTV